MKIKIYNRKKEVVATMLFDSEDYNLIKSLPLYLNSKNGYITTLKNKKTIGVHRLIMGDKNKLVVDHINRNKLDNRKENLRLATISQNGMNRKNSKGYCFCTEKNKWISYIKIKQKLIYLGSYLKEEEAKRSRRRAELKHFREFAPL